MLSCSYGENPAPALTPAGFAIRNPAPARFGKNKSGTTLSIKPVMSVCLSVTLISHCYMVQDIEMHFITLL